MTPEEFAKSMTYLGLAYNKEFTKEQVEVWYRFFKSTEDRDFRQALSRIIEKSKYVPSIAEIKQEIANIKNPVLQLNAEEEWVKVQRAISSYGYYRADEAIESMDPFTAKVVRNMGGFRAICKSEDGDWTRRNFIKLFDDMIANTSELVIYTEPQLTAEEIKRKASLVNPFHNMITHNYDLDAVEENILKNVKKSVDTQNKV